MDMTEKRKTKKQKPVKTSQQELFRRFPSYKSNLDTMKLLTTSALFQAMVKDCREFLEIPENGLLMEDKIKEEWTNRIHARSDEKISDEAFWRKIKKIGKDVQNEVTDEEMAKKQRQLIHNDIPWNYLTYNINYIIEKFSLPLNFTESLRRYVLHNEISAPLYNFAIGPWTEGTMKISGLSYLPITIYAKLTNKELKQLKAQTESSLTKNLPKYDDLKDIDTEIELDKWNRHKERFDEVERKKYKTTAKEISKNILGSKRKTQRVYDSTRKLKKLRKQRFGIE